MGHSANRRESTHHRLVKRVHVREELIDRETLRIRDERFQVIGRMASPNWYCRTRDRFEMVRPK
jgi:hypothetical protein